MINPCIEKSNSFLHRIWDLVWEKSIILSIQMQSSARFLEFIMSLFPSKLCLSASTYSFRYLNFSYVSWKPQHSLMCVWAMMFEMLLPQLRVQRCGTLEEEPATSKIYVSPLVPGRKPVKVTMLDMSLHHLIVCLLSQLLEPNGNHLEHRV